MNYDSPSGLGVVYDKSFPGTAPACLISYLQYRLLLRLKTDRRPVRGEYKDNADRTRDELRNFSHE